MTKQIVLISGKMGSGKSTLAAALIQALSRKQGWIGFEKKFAALIYKMHDLCREVLTKIGVDIKHPIKDGNLLQLLGTEWGRKTLDENIWVEALRKDIEKHFVVEHFNGRHSNVVYLISDCRFENEFDAYPDALRVRLECPRIIRRDRAEMWRDNEDHPSEIGLDTYAENAMFDLILRTDEFSPENCADLIVAQLLKNDWIGKRNNTPIGR